MTSLASKTILEIKHAVESERSAAIGEVISIIQQLASNAFRISIEELADLIGRDPAVTEKVISAANTLGFKPSIAPVVTISQAIHTVGFEKIRNLTLTLMLAESAARTASSFEQRKISTVSVCSALLAQSIADESQIDVDTELLFVCTSLRNYGKLLLSTFQIERYCEAIELSRERGEIAAFRTSFGLTPLELTRELLRVGNIPKEIMRTVREVPSATLAREVLDDEKILILADMSVGLCEVVFDKQLEPSHFNEALQSVINSYKRCMPVDLDTVNQVLISVANDVSVLNRAIGIRDDRSFATINLNARLNGQPLPAVAQTPPIVNETAASRTKRKTQALFARASDRIEAAASVGQKVSLREIYGHAVEAIVEALELESCLVFIVEETDKEKYSARYGQGPLFQKAKNRPLVTRGKGDIFSICLHRREDILIRDVSAGKTGSIIPEWILECSATNSFAVFPAVSGGELFAMILGTVSSGSPLDLQVSDIQHLKEIRGSLADVIRMAAAGEIELA